MHGMDQIFSGWLERFGSDDAEKPLIPAATVSVLRDGPSGLETLMLRRNSKLSFAEGMWVFPGGRIDDADHPSSGPDEEAAARTCAIREAVEEADIHLDPDTLIHYSHWLPPVQAPKRFSTWFFMAPATQETVVVDQGEITDHEWLSPAETLRRHNEELLEILPPTWMTLNDLTQFDTVADALDACGKAPLHMYCTTIMKTEAGMTAAWEGDAGYESGDENAEGARHRLVMAKGGWVLERDI